MGRRVDNLLGLAVLSYLTQGPMHPYEIGTALGRHDDGRSIRYRHASLYMVVERLAAAGLVVPVEKGRDGARPERTTYALTDDGREELTRWLRELLAEPVHEYPSFVAALAFLGALPPGEVVAALDHRLAALAEQRQRCTDLMAHAERDGVHPLYLVEEEYRLTVLEAESRFVESLRGRIADPGTGWADAWSPESAPGSPA